MATGWPQTGPDTGGLILEGPHVRIASVLGVFLGLGWVFFSLRMYVRAFITGNWGLDDMLLIIAIMIFTVHCTVGFLAIKYSAGTDIPVGDLAMALKFWFLWEHFFLLSALFIRLSISVFLLRICVTRTHKIIVYATMAMVIVFSTFYIFFDIFQCSPVDYFWERYEGKQGQCTNALPDAGIAYSCVAFTADWVLGIFPMVLIWNLPMNRRTKMSIFVILALGLLAGVSAMIRIPYLLDIKSSSDPMLVVRTNVTIWATIEVGLGIIAASAYTLRPLFRSFYRGSSSSNQDG